jgi:hypothetical protein
MTTEDASRFPSCFGGAAAVVLAVSLAACAGPAAPLARPAVVLESGAGVTRVRVEIAETPETRQRGLMGRTSLEDDAGMAFLWDEDTRSAFYMKDTLIPLSIAFVTADGRIVGILDMEPCAAEPCPLYDPQASYRMALEVRKGSFGRWGVRVGDRARLER